MHKVYRLGGVVRFIPAEAGTVNGVYIYICQDI